MHYYPFNVGDYRKDAYHLTLEEHGVYRQLLDEYYLEEKPICLDKRAIMRKLRMTPDQAWALDNVLADFFIETEKGYKHLRVEKELTRWYEKSASARANVMKRYERNTDVSKKATPVVRPYNERTTDDLLPKTQDPIPNKETSELSFDEFWKVYPRKDNKKKAAVTWNRLSNKKRKLAFNDCQMRFIGCEKQFIMMPTTYLNGERWNDDPPGEPEGAHPNLGAII